jgi:hypothetical protein
MCIDSPGTFEALEDVLFRFANGPVSEKGLPPGQTFADVEQLRSMV